MGDVDRMGGFCRVVGCEDETVVRPAGVGKALWVGGNFGFRFS